MPSRTIDPVNIPPGALRFSAAWTVPAIAKDVTIQMTDDGEWASKAGAGHVLVWGVQVSPNGTNWTWILWSPGRDNPTDFSDGQAILFGHLNRGDGGLPSMEIGSETVLAQAGHRARLAIQVDAAIRLGATITTG